MSEKMDSIKDFAGNNRKKIIICAIIAAVIVLAASITGISIKNYKTPEEYDVQSVHFTDLAVNEDLKLIAHRGFRAIAPESSLPAYEMAGQAGYWGAEADLYRTKDGVWVISHDEKTFRLMNKSKKIEDSTYEELSKLTYEHGNNLENYQDLGICKLEDYLQKCVQFNMVPVIELKSDDSDNYGEIVQLVTASKLKAVYTSFEKDNLKEMRKITDAKLFLNTQKLNNKAISQAKDIKNCGIVFNVEKKSNMAGEGKFIKNAVKQKIELGAWNVNDVETTQTLVGYGVNYIITDCITY